jgi:chemotaxis regulatin CheY-phosphate phosphatase CheZ
MNGSTIVTSTTRVIGDALEQQRDTTVSHFYAIIREHGVEFARDAAIEWIVRADGRRATSRSTSVVTNLVADVERAIVTVVLDEITNYLKWDKPEGDETDAVIRLGARIDRQSQDAIR